MAENDRWVVQYPEGGWAVVREGRERVSDVLATQEEAIERGHEILRNLGGGELVVQGMDGRIREKVTVAGTRPGDAAASTPVAVADPRTDESAGFFARLFGGRRNR